MRVNPNPIFASSTRINKNSAPRAAAHITQNSPMLATAPRFAGSDDGPSFFDTLLKQAAGVATDFISDPKAALRRNVEDRLLYHPVKGPFDKSIIQDPGLKSQVQDINITTADGVKLHAWYVPAQPGKETIVFSHGNAGNISHRQFIMKPFVDQGFGFLAYDYRGFGNSEGTPEEKGLYKDVEASIKFLKDKEQVTDKKLIIMGESLGGAVAIDAASKNKSRLLFVMSTFTSLPNIAPSLVKNAPVISDLAKNFLPSIVQQEYNSIAKIKNITAPILIAHGDQDQLVPFGMSDELYDGATSAVDKDHVTAQGCDHNNVFANMPGELVGFVKQLLAKTESFYPEAG